MFSKVTSARMLFLFIEKKGQEKHLEILAGRLSTRDVGGGGGNQLSAGSVSRSGGISSPKIAS